MSRSPWDELGKCRGAAADGSSDAGRDLCGTVDEGIALAYREHGYTLREIVEHLGVHYATGSQRLRRFEERGRAKPAV